ncbi:MAG TPA: hypothetical protein VIK91_13825, partial [Nannocystis sp.]
MPGRDPQAPSGASAPAGRPADPAARALDPADPALALVAVPPAPVPPGPPDSLSGLLRRGLKAAIARWAVRRRPAAEWPRPQDEARHPWDGRRHFAEEFVFVGVQPEL